MEPLEKKLIKATNDFFNKHFCFDGVKFPKWSEHWTFVGEIPNHDKRGCYALFKDDEIIYIGSGLGKSFGMYEGNGLGARLHNYWKKEKNVYVPRENWKEVTSIMTIGFDEATFYLAAALEIYLIKELQPKRNKQFK